MTQVKVTGITTADDAAFAAAVGVDLIAIVFYARSPRYVDSERAWAIRDVVPSTVPLVGVFVDTPTPLVQRVVDHCRLDAAQLFGNEKRPSTEALRPYAFKAVRAETSDDIPAATREFLGRRATAPDRPALLVHLTGSVASDWDLVRPVAARASLVLASDALSAATAAKAVGQGRPWAVDVWEAVETAPGTLDRDALAAFVRAVREADAVAPSGAP